MGSLPLLPLYPDVVVFAPDIDPKLSMSLSLSSAPLPCCASTSYMLFCSVVLSANVGVCAVPDTANYMGRMGIVGGTRLKYSAATLQSFSSLVVV